MISVPLLHLRLESAAALAHAQPTTAEHGKGLEGWQHGGPPGVVWVRLCKASIPLQIAAGAKVVGWDASSEEWDDIHVLNNGAAINIAPGQGYGERLIDIGVYSRLSVVDEGDGGTHRFQFTPVEVRLR